MLTGTASIVSTAAVLAVRGHQRAAERHLGAGLRVAHEGAHTAASRQRVGQIGHRRARREVVVREGARPVAHGAGEQQVEVSEPRRRVDLAPTPGRRAALDKRPHSRLAAAFGHELHDATDRVGAVQR